MRRENGKVLVTYTINREGKPEDVRVVSSTFPELGLDVARALASWRYEPARSNGQPLAVKVRQTFHFEIRGEERPLQEVKKTTPLDKYIAEVGDLIRKKWSRLVEERLKDSSIGIVVLNFRITSQGTVKNIEVVSNSGNDALSKLTIETIQSVELPPIPASVRSKLHNGVLDALDFTFTVY